MSATFRRNFTITIPAEIVPALERIRDAEGFTNESQLIVSLVRQAVSATPMLGAATATRSAAFNDVRYKVLRMVNSSFRDIQRLIEREIPPDEDQSRPAPSEDGPV